MKFLRCLVYIAITLLPVFNLYAQQAANPADNADGREGEFALLSCSSLSKIAEMAKEYGINLPPLIQTATLEKMFPFLGADNIDEDRPYGVIYLAGDNISKKNSCVFCIPLCEPEKALSIFSRPNAVKVEGVKNMITIDGMPFRLLGDYFVFGGTQEYVAFLQNVPITAHYAGAENLRISLSLDFKSLRAHFPTAIDSFIDMIDKQNKTKNEEKGGVSQAREAGQKAFYDWLKSFSGSVDTVKVKISSNEKDLGFEILSQPVSTKLKDMKFKGVLPPPSSPIVVNLNGCSEMTNGIVDWFLKMMTESREFCSANDSEKVKTMMKSLVGLIAGGDSVSVGFSRQDDAFAVYVVNQFHEKPDLDSKVRDFMANADKAAPLMNEESIASCRRISLPGKSDQVCRISLMSMNEEGFFINAFQKDNRIFVAMSNAPMDYLTPWISNLKESGELKPGMSISVDIAKFLDFLQQDPASKLSMLSDEALNSIEGDFTEECRFEYVIKDNLSQLGVQVSKKNIKSLQKLFATMSMLPVPKPGSEAELERIERQIKANPDYPNNYLARGRCLRDKDDYKGAIASYDEAIKRNSKYYNAYFSRGEANYYLGENGKAIADLQKSLELVVGKNRIYPMIRLWHISGETGEKKMYEDISKSISSWKYSAENVWPEPCLKFISGQSNDDELLSVARKAVSIRSSICESYYIIGVKALLEGKKDAARDSFQKCVDLKYTEQREYDIAKFELKKLDSTPAATPNQ